MCGNLLFEIYNGLRYVWVLVTFKTSYFFFVLSHKGTYGFIIGVFLNANFSMKKPKLTSLFLGGKLKTC